MNRKYYPLVLCATILAFTCCTPKGNPVSDDAFSIDNDFYMLQDGKLPQSVDLTQDISGLDYQNLRLLRSYVYAIHGHWFMEGDLNAFFHSHTQWYDSLCWALTIDRQYSDSISPAENERIDAYVNALWDDYAHAYELIPITPDEQAFVVRIDQRMAQLHASKDLRGEDGVTLLNPNLMVNWFQVSEPDPMLGQRLMLSNVAFTTTQYEQLFNVYEENEYHLMPSFITTDVMLQAYHMYFNYVLYTLERHTFSDNLAQVFQALSQQNQSVHDPELATLADQTAAYCAVALRLLGQGAPVQASIADVVDAEYNLVMQGEDALSPLFQTETYFNYSLFRPRGHYTRTEADQRYFRAMQWMQKGCFYREKPQQLRWAIYLASLINQMPAQARQSLNSLNHALCFLMGEPDNLSIIELAAHLESSHITQLSQALSESNVQAIDAWLKQGFQRRNRISPKVAVGPQDQLNMMPQRYNVDGEILGHLFDEKPNSERAYPMGLDLFSIFGVQSATALLDTCYHTSQQWPGYQAEFDKVKPTADAFQDWDSTFYNKWLQDLIVLQQPDQRLPGFMQTRTWQLKNLNTGLASWALLKHDAILYAEQPMGAECGGAGLPDPICVEYVEPNVNFWQKLRETLQLNATMLTANGFMTNQLQERTTTLQELVDLCLRVAGQEVANTPVSKEDFVQLRHFGSSLEWFTLSVIDPDKVLYEWSDIQGAERSVAQVADVFTRNIDGCDKDGILYEAAGHPHAIYVVVEVDGQSYLTRGATYSYYEFVRPLSQPRLTDEEWQQMLQQGHAPATTEWFAPLLLQHQVVTDERYVYSTGC